MSLALYSVIISKAANLIPVTLQSKNEGNLKYNFVITK